MTLGDKPTNRPTPLRCQNVWEGRDLVPFHLAVKEAIESVPLHGRDRLATLRGGRAVPSPVQVDCDAVRYLGLAVTPHRQRFALGRRSKSGIRVSSGDAVHPAPVAMDSFNEGCNAWAKPARVGIRVESGTDRRE